MSPEEKLNLCYIGDGAYAELTPYDIILRTGNYQDGLCDNKIHLETTVLLNFLEWLVSINRIGMIKNPALLKTFQRLGKDCEKILTEPANEI